MKFVKMRFLRKSDKMNCKYCGNEILSENPVFCEKCGKKLDFGIKNDELEPAIQSTESNNNQYSKNLKSNKQKKNVLHIILASINMATIIICNPISWILGVIAIIFAINSNNTATEKERKSKLRISLILSLIGIFLAFVIGIGFLISDNDSDILESSYQTEISEDFTKEDYVKSDTVYKETESEYLVSESEKTTAEPTISNSPIEDYGFDAGDLSQRDLIENFLIAARDVNIAPSKIRNITQIENWHAGERYRFSYEGLSLTLYANADNSIHSINVGGINVYSYGLTPLDINDYIMDIDTSYLIVRAEEAVKRYLNYPKTAKFDWFWQYGRNKNLYIVRNSLSAQNAFGVEKEYSFSVEFLKENDRLTTTYVSIDGVTVFGERKQVTKDEREEIIVEESENEIVLTDGLLGKYGEKKVIDGFEYIWYHVPEGTYEVTARTNNAMLWIDKNELITNSEGYKEAVTVSSLRLANVNDKGIIEIRSDEHIFLVINTVVELRKID